MFFKKCVFPFLAAAVCAAALCLPQFLGEEPLFAGAESYLFYAGSASSQAYIVPADAENAAAVRRSLYGRTGESAVYARAEDALAQAEAYGARLLFCERAEDVTDCYYYSPASADAYMSAGMRSICTSPCAGRAAASARPHLRRILSAPQNFLEKIFPRQV